LRQHRACDWMLLLSPAAIGLICIAAASLLSGRHDRH
jgi:hypothetical protein